MVKCIQGDVVGVYDNTGAKVVGYTYDALGRIVGETDSVANTSKSYVYDMAGRLVRENNSDLNKTYTYEYDSVGNVTSKKTHAYTTASTPGTATTTTNFSYDTTYSDRLTSFGGKAITYDQQGCPLTYDGKTYTWTRGKLTQISKGNIRTGRELYTFTYNGYGQRTEKIYSYVPALMGTVPAEYVSNEATTYTYDNDGRLVKEHIVTTYDDLSTEVHDIHYLYDDSGIIGMVKDSTGYYFHRNIQGDVVGVYNSSGTKLVTFKYDAYGNCTVSGDASLASYCKIRYRGYYFDTETGLYWVQTRYYNPQWCRWISPDSLSYLDPETAHGLNLYCHAINNPVGIAEHGSAHDGLMSYAGSAMAYSFNSVTKAKGGITLQPLLWLAENATTIYDTASSLVAGIPILSHYSKYASIINDEFALYGISKWKTSLQLSNVNLKMGALDGALIGVNVLIDMYDSYQRGVSTEGILLGGTLTAASSIGMLYLNKGIMWTTTTIGTAICPGFGTAIGFGVGLIGSILLVMWLGNEIADWIDSNIK